MLTISVLGPVEVRRDGRLLAVPAGRTTEVLVRLALDAGRPVRAERVIEDLWAGAAAATGRNTLQSKVSQLRRALGDPGLVTGGAGGYTLRLEPEAVDALRVVRLAGEAAEARRAGDPAVALEAAGRALALFRGEVLADAGDGDWLHAHRVRLTEVQLGLLEDRLAARVDLSVGGDVIGELEAAVDRYPLREGLWSCLITALYRAGRQADALAAYARVRTTLVEQLGIEPGPDLRALEREVLRQSPSLDVRPASDPPVPGRPVPGRPVPGRPSAPPPSAGNVPSMTSPLVGRADDLAALAELMERRRLVTVVGPSGVGKTRAAVEVARGLDAAGGVWLVRLDAVDAGAVEAGRLLTGVVAETLGVSGGESVLVERLLSAPTVLVLDNCEHVLDAAADLAAQLLDAAAPLRVLATSQVPLGLDGEAVYPLEPLGIEAAVELFAGRATELRRQFTLDDETVATVEEICRSLDGLPLAIELAAARVRSLSLPEIARRLDDRFALLRDPTSRRPERRRALAAAIAWSYHLLFPDDQRGLWALSCFAGGAPLAAAEHVLGALGVPAPTAVDVVGRLVDRSLVGVEIQDSGTVRYRLLDSIRAFAADRLHESGLDDVARAAHAAWFAEVADRCAATVRGGAQPDCLALVRAERANVDAALAWCAVHDPALGVRIAVGLGWTWIVLGDGVAGAVRLRNALVAADVADAAGARDRATGLLLAGWLEASAGNVDQAQAGLDAASVLAEALGDDVLRADVRRHRAFLRIQQGRPRDVLVEASAALDTYRAVGRAWETGGTLLLSAYGSIMLGDTVAAAQSAGEAVELLTPIADSWALVHAEAMLGAIAQAESRFADAEGALTRAAAASERLGFLGQAALHLTRLGRVEQRAGRPEAAAKTLERAIAAAATSGDPRMAATARIHLARVRRDAGDSAAARALLEEADRWYRVSGGGDGALLARALLLVTSAAPDDDGSRLAAVLAEARTADDPEAQVTTLDALAHLAARRGDPDVAAQHLEEADRLAAAVPHLVDDADRHDARLARQTPHQANTP